jgi:hypothetical protein
MGLITDSAAFSIISASALSVLVPSELTSPFISRSCSGSNTTGYVAEQHQRRWLSLEIDRSYAALSAVRFTEGWSEHTIRSSLTNIETGKELRLRSSDTALFDSQAESLKPNPPSPDEPSQTSLFAN